MQNKPLFVTGIGTSVGKTIVSAVLCEQLEADYWKPVQSGDLDHSDSDEVRKLISNSRTIIHPEAFRLNIAASPHQSARMQGIQIRPEDFHLPETDHQLLIEGAGGLFVPLAPGFLMSDLITLLQAEVVLVARDYLGCINHTLLSLHALQALQIPVRHLVLNGSFNPDTKAAILEHIPQGSSWSQLPELSSTDKVSVANSPIQLYRHTVN